MKVFSTPEVSMKIKGLSPTSPSRSQGARAKEPVGSESSWLLFVIGNFHARKGGVIANGCHSWTVFEMCNTWDLPVASQD